MKLSISMSGLPFAENAPLARRADELGFESIWIPEHLLMPKQFAEVYPYNATGNPNLPPDMPFADPWVMLGHLAAHTTRVLLGVGVFVLPLRNPYTVAKAVATAHALSDNRILMGIGIGWMREEFEIVGERFERRGARTEEMIEVMNKLWTGEIVEHHGEFYKFGPVRMAPGLETPPLMVFGGTSDAGLRRAAKLGAGWYGPAGELPDAIDIRKRLFTELKTVGRDPSNFKLWVRALPGADRAILAGYRESGFDRLVVPLPRDRDSTPARLEWIEELTGFL
jgi:probable F420-dependent oxidoreductase